MMDDFSTFEGSPKVLRHNEAMFKNITVFTGHLYEVRWTAHIDIRSGLARNLAALPAWIVGASHPLAQAFLCFFRPAKMAFVGMRQ